MFFKMDISLPHASLHMENLSPNKPYDLTDCASTHSWPLLPLIQGNDSTQKTINGFCHLRSITHDKIFEGEKTLLAP